MKHIVTHLDHDARKARGLETYRKVIGWLPADGRPMRSQTLIEIGRKEGISKPTVYRQLKKGERQYLVLRKAGISKGKPYVFYTLNVKRLLPWSRDVLEETLANDAEWATYFQERKKIGTRTNKDLEDFLRAETYMLVNGIEQMLFKAQRQPNKETARKVVEAAIDWVMRRWLGSLGEVMWVRRDDSGIALSNAMEPLMKVIEKQDSRWRATLR